LGPALASLATRTQAANEIEVHADVRLDEDRRLAPDIETTVYRVVQESLTNVVKHARASRVELSVRCTPDAVEVSVADDGVGFDPAERSGAGFGLAGMRERVELAGGELDVSPGDESGTSVRVRLPLA
jgi:signal transduction histidine kinase